jgi:integrase
MLCEQRSEVVVGCAPATASARKRGKCLSRRSGQSGYVELKNGVWFGRYYVDVPGQQERKRVRVKLGFLQDGMKRSEAERKLKGVIDASGVNSVEYKIPSAETFAERAESWKKEYLAFKKPSTRKTMEHHINKYLVPKFGAMAVDAVTPEVADKWVKTLPHLKTQTLKHIIATLQLALGVRFGKGKIKYPSAINAESDDARCFSRDEVAAIVSKAREKGREMYAVMFALAAGTGLRAGELYALGVSDVDLERKVITVWRSAFDGAFQTTKTKNSRRKVAIGDALATLIKNYLAGRTDGLMFPTRNGKPFRNNNVLADVLHPILRELNIELGGLHAFRHHRVSELVMAGVSMPMIRSWIGHGSDRMVSRYTHLNSSYNAVELAKIPELDLVGPKPFLVNAA